MDFPSLNFEIFLKTSKNKMRVPAAVKLHSASMLRCIELNGHRISDQIPVEQLSDMKIHVKKSNRWTDVMNGTRNAGCEPINNINHPHIFELLSYASHFQKWKQSVHADSYVPESTYEDVLMTCFGVVLSARFLLPLWESNGYADENIMQRRHGTDDLENLFCKSRGGNANANSKDTNHNVSGNVSGCMNSLALSSKANGEWGKRFNNSEVDSGKIKRVKLGYK